jgi:uncharacterized protein
VVRILLPAGADANTRLPDGKTILMKACDRGDLIMMKLLLEAGADPNLKDKAGATALMWASHRGHLEAVKFLLQNRSIALDEKNEGGYTALMLARFNNYPQVIELLKAAGAKE